MTSQERRGQLRALDERRGQDAGVVVLRDTATGRVFVAPEEAPGNVPPVSVPWHEPCVPRA